MATTTQPSSSNKSSQIKNQSASSKGFQEGQLDQFMSYMKENWKTILSELVAAGVTTYLAHSAKERNKQSKN